MTRMQKKRILFAVKKMWLLNLLLAIMTSGTIYMYWVNAAVPVTAINTANYTLMGMATWRDILFWGIPGLAEVDKHKAAKMETPISIYGALNDVLQFFTNVNGQDLGSILRAELPSLALVAKNETPVSGGRVALPNPAAIKAVPEGKPVVGIYHTHTAESFIPSTGVAHRPGGQIGEICKVGDALVQTLGKSGFVAMQDTTIHDSPSFMKAYGASEVTLQRMVKENPSLQMVFDIHRDAEKRENVVGVINGETTAKISIIVAQGQKDLPQPNWQKNYTLAKLIDQKCNQKYPGLSRGIQLVEWRYNQHLHPHALLLEVGSHEVSTEEAMRAMELLADVLADILKESSAA